MTSECGLRKLQGKFKGYGCG